MYGKMIRQFGNKPASKTYYETDACVLITTWGNEGKGREWNWTDGQHQFSNKPRGNPLELVREIHQKYRPLFNISND